MRTPRRRLRGVLSLIAMSSAAALLVAGIALPGVVLVGAVTKSAADSIEGEPAGLDPKQPARPSVLYAADGKTRIATFYSQYRRVVTLQQISPTMRKAIVAAEDRRFYEHGAVDAKGVLRAAAANIRGGGIDQGASTLTMQYVRNVLKNDQTVSAAERKAATEDTLGRKLQEVRYAADLERKLTKDEILSRYLNIAYFGSGAYGIDAAAVRYFGVRASKLNIAQSALLAGLVQAPDAYNPITGDKQKATERRAYVLSSMQSLGVINATQAATANKAPLGLKPRPLPAQGCTGVPADHDGWGFYCDYFVRWWNTQAAFGKTPAERQRALEQGGYSIVGTLDEDTQSTAQEQALGVYGYDSQNVLPIAVVQPGTGRVLAMAVNRHYGLKGGATVAPLVSGGGGIAGYQAGSTFKMFTMLAALESGMPLSTYYDAPSRIVTHWPDSGENACDGQYCPANQNPAWMDGPRTMWTGFGRSVNTYFVHLEEEVGADKVVEMAQRLGITFRASSDARQAQNGADWGSFTLGVSATTPLDLASAYATLGADGMTCAPLPVTSVKNYAGKVVAGAADPSCKRTLSPEIARAAADAARCPVGQQSAFGRCDGGTATAVSGIVGRPVAGKTGSAQGNETETFVGVTPQAAAAGIAANPTRPDDAVGSAVSPAVNAAVARTLATALTDLPYEDFEAPSYELAFGDGTFPGQPR